MSKDSLNWQADWMIQRWDEAQTARLREAIQRDPVALDFERADVDPYDVSVVKSNLLTTAGLTRITSLITAGGGQGATNTSARLGTGDGAGSAAVGDTDLGAAAGSTHRWFQIMDATFPSTAAGVITFKATFASADGNFAWNEFGIDIGTPTVSSANTVNATLLNHKTGIAQGTKTSGQTWAATATITLS